MARFTRASTKYINACKNIEVQPIRLKFNTWKERNLCTFLEFDNIRVIFSSWFETDFKRNSSIRCLIHDSWIKFYVLWISSSNITDPFLFMETEYKIEIQKFEYHSWVRCHCFVKTLIFTKFFKKKKTLNFYCESYQRICGIFEQSMKKDARTSTQFSIYKR